MKKALSPSGKLGMILSLILTMVFLIFCALPHGFALSIKNQVTGINDPLLKNVLASLKSQQEVEGRALTVNMIKRWYANAPQNIKLALQPYGYFSPTIDSKLKALKGHIWLANFHITKGPQTHIDSISIQITGPGANNKRFQRYLRHLPLKRGAAFASQTYNRVKGRLSTIANNLGYLDAKFTTSQVRVNTLTRQAAIVLILNTGRRYFYGPIAFNKTPYTQPFLQRFLNIKQGEAFSPNKLIRLQQNLTNSGFFQQASVNPLTTQRVNDKIPVAINLSPYPAQQYLLGGGYGTDTGVRGTIGTNFRRVTNTGQQFKTIVQASQKNNSLLAQYTIPGQNPLTEQYAITGLIENLQPQGLTNRVKRLSLSYITNQNRWQRTLALNYQLDTNKGLPNIKTHTHLLYPSLSYLYINAKNPVHTLHGARIGFSLAGGASGVASDANFVQVQINGKMITQIWPNMRLVLRGNAGHTITDETNNIPLSLLFFAGGANSIRGYGYQDLGPGTSLLVGSAEVQQRVYGNWYISGFFDAGNALNNFKHFSDLKRAAGFGVVLITAIGPIELSLARPIGDPQNNRWRIQFTMGPDL